MKVAVITAAYREPDAWLQQCLGSVARQTYSCTHFIIGDGVDRKISLTENQVPVTLPRGVANYGDTPRAIGSIYAAGLGFDAVTYLDADNWYHPRHIESLVQLAIQDSAAIVSSCREFRHLETGEFMAECLTSDGERFCDTNCLFLTRSAFSLLATWTLMDPDFHVMGDRVIWWDVLTSGLPRSNTGLASLAYRATHVGVYQVLKRPIPQGAKKVDMQMQKAFKKWGVA